MDFYKRALALREETISHRRWLHSNAEVVCGNEISGDSEHGNLVYAKCPVRMPGAMDGTV